MADVTSRYRLHSARRGGSGPTPVLTVVILAVIAVIALIAVLSFRGDSTGTVVQATPTPSPAPEPAAVPQPTRPPTPITDRRQSGWVDAPVVVPPSPSPTMAPIPAPPTRAPRATPTVGQCAVFTWSTLQVFTPSAQVKVDLRVRNRCPYELGPDNLLFEITGWRNGDRIQSVRGVPMEPIRRGMTGEVSIGLPGSEDWYDRIEVVVID